MNIGREIFTYDLAGLQEAIKLEQEAGFDIQISGRPAQRVCPKFCASEI